MWLVINCGCGVMHVTCVGANSVNRRDDSLVLALGSFCEGQ